MQRRTLLAALGFLPLLAHAQTPSLESLTSATKNPLLGALTSQLGLTENQARGGVGSYLTLLQEKLAKGDFDKIAPLVTNYLGKLGGSTVQSMLAGALK